MLLREVSIIPMKDDEHEGTVIQVLSDISQFPIIHLSSHNPSNSNPITGGALYAVSFCLTQGEVTQPRYNMQLCLLIALIIINSW